MNHFIKWLFILPIILLSCRGGNRAKLSHFDNTDYYHPERTRVYNKALYKRDSIEIFLGLENPILFKDVSLQDFIKNFDLTYKIVPESDLDQILLEDSIPIYTSLISKVNDAFYLSFTVPKIKDPKPLLVIHKHDHLRKRVETSIVDLELKTDNRLNSFILFKSSKPWLKNYISVDDTIAIIDKNKNHIQYTITQVQNEFKPALPPHEDALTKNLKPKPDTSFSIRGNELVNLRDKGLFLITKGHSEEAGASILITDKHFPYLTSPIELIDPLIYLLSPQELEKMKCSHDLKIALDSFWLKTGGSQEYAKFLIKSYYEKVEYSNQLFTSYKEGWKTDRGMIFIVFGKPDEVYITERGEEWVYNNIVSRMVSFSFIKKETLFLNKDYELVRNPDYEKYWNTAIEKWRNGIITK